ncbi:MAG: hypothetical protein V5A23_09440 [Halobacteriales archaeon]
MTGGIVESPDATPEAYAVRVDEDGDEEWTETYDEGRLERPFAAGSGYVVAGAEGKPGRREAKLLKLDDEGDEQWSETYDRDDYSSFWDVVPQQNGGLLGGLFGSSGYVATGSSWDDGERGQETGWLVAVDGSGDQQTEVVWDDDGGSMATSVETLDGGYAITGYDDPDGSEDSAESEARIVVTADIEDESS